MPNRILSNSILTSDSLSRLTWFEQCVFFRLLVLADDYGRYDARPAIIRGQAFALFAVTDKQIQDALTSLETAGIVDLYDVGGRPYLQLETWAKYQRVRNSVEKYPANDNPRQVAASCGELPQKAAVIQSNPIQSESESESESAREARHAHGQYGWVKLADDQYAKLKADLGEAEAERCIAYIDESAQSTGNKNKWKDWNLTVRKCSRDGWGLGRRPMSAAEYSARPQKAIDMGELRKAADKI